MRESRPNIERVATDVQIRALLRKQLLAIHDQDTLVVEELGLLHGACRADIAVVNGTMHGYELKSDRDTLKRLSGQIAAYNSVFDFVTLVVGERHLMRAIEAVPDWWGIRVARVDHGSLIFRDLRLGMINVLVDPMSTLRLLWRQEALDILSQTIGRKVATTRPREWIYAELLQTVGFAHLRDEVRRCLKNRKAWRPAYMSRLCGD